MRGGLYNPRPVDDTPVNGQLTHGVTSNWAFDHAADIDAHHSFPYEQMRTGAYYSSCLTLVNYVFIIAANQLYALPLWVPRDITTDRIAIQVTTGAAGNLRLGIYNDGTNLYPGTLLLDGGVVDTTAVEIDAVTISQALTHGLYWLAFIADATPTLKATRGDYANHCFLGLQPANIGASLGGWRAAQAYGALPDPYTAGGAVQNNMQQIAVRIESLD